MPNEADREIQRNLQQATASLQAALRACTTEDPELARKALQLRQGISRVIGQLESLGTLGPRFDPGDPIEFKYSDGEGPARTSAWQKRQAEREAAKPRKQVVPLSWKERQAARAAKNNARRPQATQTVEAPPEEDDSV